MQANEQLNAMQHANLPQAMPPQPPPHNQRQNQPMPPHHIPASLPNTSNQFNVHQQENQPPKHPTKCSYSAIFSLQSLTHFLLKIGSHPSINDAFRGIMGANKVGSGSGQTHWAAPLSSYEAVRTVLDKLSKDPSSGLCISLKPLPELALRVLRISQAAHDDSELLTVLKVSSLEASSFLHYTSCAY